MSKQNKNSRKIRYTKDFTINDYANSTQASSRSKKSEVSIVNVVKKELDIKEHWDDDDLDDEVELTNNNISPDSKTKKGKNKQDEFGVNYPIDIWFLISEHIRPEDVGNFAAICQNSYAVIQSVRFWKSLYKRYYNENLPPNFQPECVLRHYGLRTAVIRALFLMYPPFVHRSQDALLGIKHPDVLIGMTCVGLTSKTENKNGKQILIYYFKFRRKTVTVFDTNRTREESLVDLLNDINANPDEDHSMLLAVTNKQICFMPIIGKTLKTVSLKLSKGFCASRLELGFGNSLDSFTGGSLSNGETIVLDPVINLSILNWWHPMYIKTNNVPLIEDV